MTAAMVGLEHFISHYPAIEAEIIQELREWSIPEEGIEWIQQMMAYNVPGGKMNRGLTVQQTITFLLNKDHHSMRDAAILGWCIEVLQASFLMANDMMDESLTRRGRPCWYKKVGNCAINDAMLLQSIVYRILRHHFSSHPSYQRLVDLFLEVTYQTELGQLMDLITAPTGKANFDRFTEQRYTFIIRWKTAYYSFYLPVALGIILTGEDRPGLLEACKAILIPLGEFFQIQDDYLDCFGDATLMGKIGTDIAEGKCTWLIVTALSRIDPEGLALLQSHYGSKDGDFVVKQIYTDLNLPQIFHRLQEERSWQIYQALQSQLEPRCPAIATAIRSLADRVFFRQK